MSSTLLIAIGDKAPENPAENTAFHQGLVDRLNVEAKHYGWEGATFDTYWRRDGWVAITIAPGASPATLEQLREFREAQRKALEEAEKQPEQGRLI